VKFKNTLFVGACALVLTTASLAQWTPPGEPAERVAGAGADRATTNDPIGDTFNPGPDLTALTAVTDNTTLTLRLEFAGTIQPPPSGPINQGLPAPGNEVVGFIDLDVDQQGATGQDGGNVGVFCPQAPTGFGVDFFVNLNAYDSQTGTVQLFDTNGPVGPVPVVYTSNSITVDVPNSMMGDDGIVDAATVIGNLPNPTDCAPDGGVLTSDRGVPAEPQTVPVLSPWGLGVMALFVLLTGLIVRRIGA
jgi:hypothetical protein